MKTLGINKTNPKGFLVLEKIPNLNKVLSENIVSKFKDLKNLKSASIGQLCLVEGIDNNFAKYIKSELERFNQDIFSI